MPKRMTCPGCKTEMIPVRGDEGQLNCRECDRLLEMPVPTPDELDETREQNLRECFDSDDDLTSVGKALVKTRKEKFRELLLQHVKTYLDEAEHQDGEGYVIRLFDDEVELLEDFVIYLQVLKDDGMLSEA